MYTADMTRDEAAAWVAYLSDKPAVTGQPLTQQEDWDLSDCRDRVAELEAIAQAASRN